VEDAASAYWGGAEGFSMMRWAGRLDGPAVAVYSGRAGPVLSMVRWAGRMDGPAVAVYSGRAGSVLRFSAVLLDASVDFSMASLAILPLLILCELGRRTEFQRCLGLSILCRLTINNLFPEVLRVREMDSVASVERETGNTSSAWLWRRRVAIIRSKAYSCWPVRNLCFYVRD